MSDCLSVVKHATRLGWFTMFDSTIIQPHDIDISIYTWAGCSAGVTVSPHSVPCHLILYHVTPVCTMSPQYVPSTWQMCGEARSWGRSRYGRLYGRPIKVVLWLCWYYIYVENNRCNTYQLETQHLINGTDLTYQRATKTTPCHTCIHEALPKWMTIHELPR